MRELINMRFKRVMSSAVVASTLLAGMVAIATPASASVVYGPYATSAICNGVRSGMAGIATVSKCRGYYVKNADGSVTGGWFFTQS
jgi:hypothetical protein